VGLSVTLGLIVAGYGLSGSYITISELAARRGVPLASLVPAGIDGGLLAIVLLDLVLAWIGTPVGWLRQLVRILSVGTVAANAAGGWPDPIAVGLHAAAPLMLLAMIEAGRTVLLRRMGDANGTRRDPIPLARWVLAPRQTWLLWRRMVLWRITDYRRAVETELELRRAVALLRAHFGHHWRRHAPTDLVWMLRTGTHVDEACARALATVQAEGTDRTGSTADIGNSDNPAAGTGVHRQSAAPADTMTGAEPPAIGQTERDRYAHAVHLNQQHWAQNGRPISAETLRKQLRLGAAKSRAWCHAIRAADRAAACHAN
jgi:hypothetical protein